MPREGIERISLKLRGKSLQLDRKVIDDWGYGSDAEVFTQRLYVASPGGSYLAYAHRESGALRVRDRRGHERTIAGVYGRDVRFSPDERFLATIRSPKGGGVQVSVMDLATGALRDLGAIEQATWLEWVDGGLVASSVDGVNQVPVITLYPLDGTPRLLASGLGLDRRFTTARRGSRVMYFVDKRVYLLDTANADAEPLLLGELPAAVNNAEMAPDGREAAIVTGAGLTLARGEEMQLELVNGDSNIHSVWYSDDGAQLAYASPGEAVVLAGEQRYTLDTDEYDLSAMRFHQGGTGLVVAMGTRALLWQPETGARVVLGDAGANRTMVGAEVYAGGTVLWSREVRVKPHERMRGMVTPQAANLDPFALAD